MPLESGAFMRFLALVALALLAGCTPSNESQSNSLQADSDPPKPSIPDRKPVEYAVPEFKDSFVPHAVGNGNFEICLTDDAEENDLTAIMIPEGTVFQSWGQITGPLRGIQNFDRNTTSGEHAALQAYAVVTIESAQLSVKQPCHNIEARPVVNDSFGFGFDSVPFDRHLNFQAGGLMRVSGNYIDNPKLKEPLSSAFSGGYIVGTPTKNIGDGIRLDDKP
ncbi:MAG TPA: hypothetical protein VF503_12175 [Sphingobium sp.]